MPKDEVVLVAITASETNEKEVLAPAPKEEKNNDTPALLKFMIAIGIMITIGGCILVFTWLIACHWPDSLSLSSSSTPCHRTKHNTTICLLTRKRDIAEYECAPPFIMPVAFSLLGLGNFVVIISRIGLDLLLCPRARQH